MIRIARTFYGKLCAALLLLLLFLGAIQIFILASFSSLYTQERDQMIQWSLARQLAEQLQPLIATSVDYTAVERALQSAVLLNPRADFYLLAEDGAILFSLERREELQRRTVDVAPLRIFAQSEYPQHLPLFGDNPRSAESKDVFSAAAVTLAGHPGYVYIILASGGQQPISKIVQTSYIVKNALALFVMSFLIVGAIGMASFLVITKRVEKMTEAVRGFEKGESDRRVQIVSNDEIAELGIAFNRMADTINDNTQQLEKMDAQRREMVAIVAHDLRGPLTSIFGYLDTLVTGSLALSAEAARDAIETAYRNTKSLMKMVDELFELARLEARDVAPTYTAVDVRDCIDFLVMKFAKQAHEKQITLQADYLPSEEQQVFADSAMLERALSNLVDNALKYTRPGGTVTIRANNGANGCFFEVVDSGEGISAADLPKIFGRFYRTASELSRKEGGTGLGLAIVQKIVEAHGSTISVESELGHGTKFSFAIDRRARGS